MMYANVIFIGLNAYLCAGYVRDRRPGMAAFAAVAATMCALSTLSRLATATW